MHDGEPLVWYANSDDPYYTLRHSGLPMVGISLLPAILVFCVAGTHGPGGAILLALVPLAVVAAVWEFVADRRAVVEIRLTNGDLTMIRANGSTARYPISDVRRIDVIRSVRGGVADSSRMWLHIGTRVERTRHGPADLSPHWTEAITAAEIEVQVREKHSDD